MNSYSIRKVAVGDLELLQEISRNTFLETFADSNTEKNMALYLEQSLSLEKLKTELLDPHSAFYFLQDGDLVIGFLKINESAAQTELNEAQSMEIERIYVRKAHHGKKLGQLLFDKALALAQEKNCAYLWLGVWEKNLRAIRFYEKNGLVQFGQHVFQLGDDAQTDILMKLVLNKTD